MYAVLDLKPFRTTPIDVAIWRTKRWIMVVIEVIGIYSFFCVYRAGASYLWFYLHAFIYLYDALEDYKGYERLRK